MFSGILLLLKCRAKLTMQRNLFVLSALGYGGTEKVVYSVMQILIDNGEEVSLFLPYVGGDNYKNNLPKGVKIYYGAEKKSLWQKVIGLCKLRSLIKLHDRVIAGSEKRPIYLVGFLGLGIKKSAIALIHSSLPYQLAQSTKHRWLMRWSFPQFHKVVFVSQSLQQLLSPILNLRPQQALTIYNSNDSDAIRTKSTRPLPPTINTSQSFILTVARIAPEKDLDVLIKAFAKIADKTPHTLVICGKGEPALQDKLQALCHELGVQDKVLFIGHVDPPYALMKAADLFVLSSAFEGASLVIIEALSLGKKIVTTDALYGGPAEMLNNKKFGTVVPIKDINALATAMLESLTSPKNLADSPDLPEYLQRFSPEQIKQEWLSVFETIKRA